MMTLDERVMMEEISREIIRGTVTVAVAHLKDRFLVKSRLE
jgi:hypothetical protein